MATTTSKTSYLVHGIPGCIDYETAKTKIELFFQNLLMKSEVEVESVKPHVLPSDDKTEQRIFIVEFDGSKEAVQSKLPSDGSDYDILIKGKKVRLMLETFPQDSDIVPTNSTFAEQSYRKATEREHLGSSLQSQNEIEDKQDGRHYPTLARNKSCPQSRTPSKMDEDVVSSKGELLYDNDGEGHDTSDDEAMSQQTTIEVTGFKSQTSMEHLKLYFANRDVSGGGKILETKKTNGRLHITFQHLRDADRVLDGRVHKVDDAILFVRKVTPCRRAPINKTSFLLSGLPPGTNKAEYELLLYLENCTGKQGPALKYAEGYENAMVTYPTEIHDFEKLKQKIEQKPFRNARLSFETVRQSNCVMVSNLAEETTETLLSLYFESKRSGGGEVERVELNKENASALVYFKNFMDALNVLSKKHKLGDTMVHVESFYDFLGRGIPDSHTPDVEAETSTVIPLTPLQVRQLAILDFPSIAEKDYASAKIIIDHETKKVRIGGDMENMDHIKTMAYKFLADVKVKVVPSSPFATFLSSEKARSQLTRVLKDSGVLAVYDSQGGDIIISAVNQNDLHAAADVLYANVHQRVLNVPSESHSCLRGPGWQVFVNKAEEKFEVAVEYFTSQSDRVTITGFIDHVDGATADIQRYIDCNTTIDRFIDVAGGKVEFMFKHMKADLGKLTETGIEIKKKKDENPRATGVIIHGTKQNIDNGEKSIREYLDAICHDRRYMNEPGISRLFQHKEGQAYIRLVQDQNRCIIVVSICRDGRTGLTEEIEAPQRLHSSLTTVCHVHLYAGPRVLVMKGDITKMRVDAIVNPANNRLDHGGGVAKAIIDAGGKIIQEESKNIIENRGKLLDGEVVSTQPGRLHCKRLIHAVGPKWEVGSGKDSEKQRKEKKLLLADAVTQSLEEARKWSCKSVAIPAISSGIFGFPVDVCTDVIVEAVETYIQESRLELIDGI
ncbi:protein mono-ADP-ribosyltransferase PARP14-like [Ptychodera flava]|uniref:protein mono-ADP-ribosyltransferase PARP14-like n=1 Tax=Ptychodera flava TaxID=63121 RepID=UPI003969C74C